MSAREREAIRMPRNEGIERNREVMVNTDIIIKNKKDRICMFIDVAIPSDRNLIQKKTEKILNYRNLNSIYKFNKCEI
jgi:hypothetical protein